jgi:hypothetical protein
MMNESGLISQTALTWYVVSSKIVLELVDCDPTFSTARIATLNGLNILAQPISAPALGNNANSWHWSTFAGQSGS